MIMTLDAVRDWVTARITQLRANGDRGEIPAQLVWMGVIVALAIAAGAVITTLVMNKANSINLQ
jgi:fatty acid desaturase